jgi:hypothetical protein
MTEINYTHIVLDAIYEHSKFSSNFIKRECLKANEKHINNEEFYSSLLDAVKFFEIKINDIYTSNLNRYFIGLNEDDLLPKENKTYYPKPELDKIGIPLFSYSNKYLGLTLYIEYLNNIKSIIHEASIGNNVIKIKNISAPTVAVFCQIINHSGILKQGELSNADYCKKVILEFKLNANPSTARKYYNQTIDLNKTSKRLIDINDLILPFIPKEKREKVKMFINNNTKYYN